MPILSGQANRSRYGKSLANASILERYEAQISAPDLLSLRDEASLVSARINQLLERLEGAGVDYNTLSGLHQALLMHIKTATDDCEDNEEFDRAYLTDIITVTNRIGSVIEAGLREATIWDEVYKLIEQRRRLSATEVDTMKIIGGMLSMEQYVHMVNKFMAAASLHIGQDKMALLYGEMNKILDLVPTPNPNQ